MPRANDIIEEATKLRSQGATDEDLMDYVKTQTAQYGGVFNKSSKGLSKIRVSSKDREFDAESERLAQKQQFS